LVATQTAKAAAHEAFLRFSTNVTNTIATQAGRLVGGSEDWHDPPVEPIILGADAYSLDAGSAGASPSQTIAPVALDRDQCLEFAVGSIASVLGPEFA
jgi:hypothetical protein